MAARIVLAWLLLPLLLWTAEPAASQARSESEARTECFARCLSQFKSQVSRELLSTLAREPQRINPECNAKPGQIGSRRDRNATRQCQQCTYACNNFATQAYESERTCESFCQRVHSQTSSSSVGDSNQDEARVSASSASCLVSCRILQNLLVTNQGDCPAASDVAAACAAGSDDAAGGSVLTCRPESERSTCYGGPAPLKCCPSACGSGFACVGANISEQLLPEVPPAPTVSWLGLQEAVRAAWDAYNLTAFPQPIVFLIQFRSYKSQRFSAAEMATSSWRSLAITTTTNLLIQEPLIGHWYQFRLAAVSVRGRRDYSNASQPIKPGREPRRPGPVRDLQEGLSRIQGAARIDVQVKWKPPETSDLPVAKYEVKWAETLGFPDQISLTNFETRVPGTQTDCILPNLKLGTTYQVSVSAIAYYGSSLQLMSRPASMYIATMQLTTDQPRAPGEGASLPHQPPPVAADAVPDCSCRERSQTPVTVHRPYWESDDLRLPLQWPNTAVGHAGKSEIYISSHIVKWTLRVCIESAAVEPATREEVVHNNPRYVLFGLRFNCHYSLQVKGLTDTGDVAVTWNTCFCTVSCRQTEVRGNAMPQCPLNEAIAQPQPPRSVQVDLLRWTPSDGSAEEASHFAAKITWQAPPPPMGDAVRAYRITWGPRVLEGVSPTAYAAGLQPRMDAQLSDARVLDRNRREFLLASLRPGLLYIVHLQAVTDFGDSQAHVARFAIPSEAAADAQGAGGAVQRFINMTGERTAVTHRPLLLLCLCLASMAP